ncbi:hypothetical protein BDK51DRAFT_38328 [Blyttiomyces helicus]|uniref:Uncharacterized protein n=1 Tax=Blyttiomyces helicus TaxID=388810 RepID=A0A4P9W862_9FUNG|nr:hypothetical protein BDK51DRAFT_38328 [Blyttiomyces helicus]|eukprot:RKO86980.1 hypothetical protein BDK51DRAFT_38328 [Blyttiomyces helicus]
MHPGKYYLVAGPFYGIEVVPATNCEGDTENGDSAAAPQKACPRCGRSDHRRASSRLCLYNGSVRAPVGEETPLNTLRPCPRCGRTNHQRASSRLCPLPLLFASHRHPPPLPKGPRNTSLVKIPRSLSAPPTSLISSLGDVRVGADVSPPSQRPESECPELSYSSSSTGRQPTKRKSISGDVPSPKEPRTAVDLDLDPLHSEDFPTGSDLGLFFEMPDVDGGEILDETGFDPDFLLFSVWQWGEEVAGGGELENV